MTTRERIIVALVSAVAIALGGAAILHLSGTSSEGESSAAVSAPSPSDSSSSGGSSPPVLSSGDSSSLPRPSSMRIRWMSPCGMRSIPMRVGCVMLLASLCFSFPVAARDWSPDEKTVGELEEDYWHFVSAGDVESYVRLWHDDIVGRPCFEWNPARKGDIGKWVRDIRDNHWKLTYQLKPLEVQGFGDDTVGVDYAAKFVYDYGDGTRSGAGLWRKFTHTWMKTDGRWKIIGGMCAAQEPVKAPRA